MNKLHKISELTNKRYNGYIEKYSLKNLNSIGSENLTVKYTRYSIIIDEILFYKKENSKIKILDVGCGFGDFYNFLIKKRLTKYIDYNGSEINPKFLKLCQEKFNNQKIFYLADILNINPRQKYDWIIFSGTFYHLPKNISASFYFNHIQEILLKSWKFLDNGLIVNFLNNDVDYRINNLFYPNYNKLIKFSSSLSRFKKQISNYPMFESTYVFYKKNFIKSKYLKKELKRYLI